MSYVFRDTQRQRMARPLYNTESIVQSHWKWRRSIDHIRFSIGRLLSHCKYSCMLYHFQVIWCWTIVTLKRSLKVIQTGTIRKLGCGFLFAFHSNYGRIFNRLWDIERQRIASLKTATFDRPYTTFCWFAIVNSLSISCTVFELFDVEWYHDVEIWVRGQSGLFKPVPFESLGAVSYSPSTVIWLYLASFRR